MIHRRHQSREIPFSFDSFLDVVANVVGIIIRLILVAWVGARSYSSLKPLARPRSQTAAAVPQAEIPPLPADPLQEELARHRQELAQAQARLLEQLRQLQLVQEDQGKDQQQLQSLVERRQQATQAGSSLASQAAERDRAAHTVVLSLEELRLRQQKLLEDIRALEKLPPLTKTLRFHTPVSQPVHTEEFLFECRRGRVAFIDVASLVAEIRDSMEVKGKGLRTQWQVQEVTEPIGPFRLRYTLQRDRGVLDALVPGSAPADSGNFRYGVTEWVVEPMTSNRGETLIQALQPGSEFRQLVERIDPQQAVVTFWVYPDSFALFRRLRDFLYDRNLVVAGRPLPDNVPITFSRSGSLSRGQ